MPRWEKWLSYPGETIRTSNRKLARVKNFKYLGTWFNMHNLKLEFNQQIINVYKTHYSLKQFIKTCTSSNKSRLKVFNAIVVPMFRNSKHNKERWRNYSSSNSELSERSLTCAGWKHLICARCRKKQEL